MNFTVKYNIVIPGKEKINPEPPVKILMPAENDKNKDAARK
jgi:hypothetical protein